MPATLEKQSRMDDYAVGHIQDALTEIEQEAIEEDREDLHFAGGQLVPIEVKNKPHIRRSRYRQVTRVGSWQLARDYTTNVPKVNIVTREFEQDVDKFVSGYNLSDDEILAANAIGEDLDAEKVRTVVEAGREHLDSMVSTGNEKHPGFVMHPSTLKVNSPYKFTSASTANAIISVLQAAETNMLKITRNREKPDTMLIAQDAFDYINFARLDNALTETILEFYLKKSAYIKQVQPLIELNTAGDDGTPCLCIYRRDPRKVKAMLFQDITFKDFYPQPWGYERPAEMRYGGIRFYKPYSALWVSNI
jgi:hypothetical protein